MSQIRIIPLALDLDATRADQAVRRANADGSPASDIGEVAITAVQSDTLRVRLFFWSSAAKANVRLGATRQIAIAGADESVPTTKIFEAVVAAGVAELDLGEGEDHIWAYDVPVSLNTPALGHALGGKRSIVAATDIELAEPGGVDPTTWRIRPSILKEVYTGGTPPAQDDPPYPDPGQIVLKIRGTVDLEEDAVSAEVENLGLGEAPAQVLLTLRTPSAESALIPCAVAGAPTADGFLVAFGAAVPAPGYKLDYLLVLP